MSLTALATNVAMLLIQKGFFYVLRLIKQKNLFLYGLLSPLGVIVANLNQSHEKRAASLVAALLLLGKYVLEMILAWIMKLLNGE